MVWNSSVVTDSLYIWWVYSLEYIRLNKIAIFPLISPFNLVHMSSLSLNFGGFQTKVDHVTVFETLGACSEENLFCLSILF